MPLGMGALYEAYKQLSLFDLFDFADKQDEPEEKPPCRIFDWRGQKKSIEFNAFKTGGNGSMKFDYIIGNGRGVKGQTRKSADFTRVSGLRSLFLLPAAA